MGAPPAPPCSPRDVRPAGLFPAAPGPRGKVTRGGAATRDRVRGHNDTPRTSSPGAVATPVLSPCLARSAVGAKTCRKRQGGSGAQPVPSGAIGCARTRAASSQQRLPGLGAPEFVLLAASMVLKAVLSALVSQGSETGFCLLGLLGLGNWEPVLGTGKGSELGACSAPFRKPALVFLKASRQHRSHRPRGPESTPG